MDQKELLTRISLGDEVAFNDLYKSYRPFIHTFFLNYVRQADLADDLCQELFIKIWDKRTSLTNIQCLKAYLRIAARNLALNALKKIALSDAMTKEVTAYYPANGYESTSLQIQHKEYHHLLMIELDKLPKRSREIFMLCREEGKSYAEAAEKMGVSRSSIKHHMIETLKSLKAFAEKRLDITICLAFCGFIELFL